MNKTILILICFCCFTVQGIGQNKQVDSLMQIIKTTKPDTAKVNTLNTLAGVFRNNNPDTSVYFAMQAHTLAIQLNDKPGMVAALLAISIAYVNLGKFDEALKNSASALTLCDRLLNEARGSGIKSYKSKILKQKAQTLRNIGIIYGSRGNYTEALKNFNASLKIAWETGDKQLIARCKSNIGLIYEYQGNYYEALNSYSTALNINQEIGDKNGIALIYGNIGNIYGSQGNYPEALKNFLASLKISEETGDKQGVARCNGNIGLVYYYQKNFPEALKYQTAALTMNTEIGEKEGVALNYGNIGTIYGNQGNFPDALKNQLAALKINAEIGNKKGVALNYGNIGNIYVVQGIYPEALKNQFASLKICEEIGDKPGIALTYYNIGEIYTKQNNNKGASQYLNSALSLAKETGSLQIINESYLKLAELDSARGNFKKSLEHYKLFIISRDSMFNKENTKKIVQAKMQYEFDIKESLAKAEHERKDDVAMKELQRQKLIRNFLIGIIGLVFLMSFHIYRGFRTRQLLRLQDIRNKIAGDLHDDIGSTLNSISIYSEVAKKNSGDRDEALDMIGDASRKVIEAMSDIVWTINPENDNFGKIIFRMKSLVYNLFRAKNIEFTFHADEILNEKKLSLEERRNFYLIFKEAVNNLVKYSNATHASITLTNENNFIRLGIRDDGVGFDLLQENAGNGLKNMKRRAEEMKAEFKIES
ncbi:MAG: tetratricopeptide repeat protein, partial [Bacteroidetes bacterium]|nr:tetratricopeptide repeat protein [Bacteroidota bacterium]